MGRLIYEQAAWRCTYKRARACTSHGILRAVGSAAENAETLLGREAGVSTLCPNVARDDRPGRATSMVEGQNVVKNMSTSSVKTGITDNESHLGEGFKRTGRSEMMRKEQCSPRHCDPRQACIIAYWR